MHRARAAAQLRPPGNWPIQGSIHHFEYSRAVAVARQLPAVPREQSIPRDCQHLARREILLDLTREWRLDPRGSTPGRIDPGVVL